MLTWFQSCQFHLLSAFNSLQLPTIKYRKHEKPIIVISHESWVMSHTHTWNLSNLVTMLPYSSGRALPATINVTTHWYVTHFRPKMYQILTFFPIWFEQTRHWWDTISPIFILVAMFSVQMYMFGLMLLVCIIVGLLFHSFSNGFEWMKHGW